MDHTGLGDPWPSSWVVASRSAAPMAVAPSGTAMLSMAVLAWPLLAFDQTVSANSG